MEPLRCPLCDAPLRAQGDDPWEFIRSVAAVHLRRCAHAPEDDHDIAMLAIQLAEEAPTRKA